MKKLLFILSAILVSVITYGANSWKHSNPFAYDLSYELRNNGNTLALIYSLNANAVTSNTYNTTHGVKINLIDEQQNSYTIRHITSSSSTCVQRGRRTVEIPISEIPAAFKDKPITWEIEVFGNKNRTSPQIIGSSGKNPINAHGIGINTDPTHQNFGQIFVSEAYPSTTDGHNSLLEFNPQLQYVKRHVKQIHIVSSTETSTTSYFSGALNYEPHRVKTTTDGRVFVTCYHPTAGGAVLEYLGNNTFKNVIAFDKTKNQGSDAVNSEHSRRVIGMDVKGEGADLKIVVAWIDANGYKYSNSKIGAIIELYEYEIGKAEAASVVMPLPQVIGTTTTSVYVKKIGEEVDFRSSTTLDGLLYQGFNGLWNSCLRGFVDVAYGKNNDVWMKIDHGAAYNLPGRIILFRNGKNIPDVLGANNQDTNSSYDDYFGGNAIIYDDYYYGSSNKGSSSIISGFSFGKIKGHKIEIADDATTKPSKMFSGQWDVSNTTDNHAERIGFWVTAFARDYAGNLYALTERRDNYAGSTADTKSFNANILCIAMPYSGSRVTRANTTFTVSDPIPNILATDLRFAPDGNSDRYVFSFNVNTTPEVAQIRFYKSYGDNGENDMKKNLAKINADDYQGGNAITPSFVYDIPADQLKPGKISVSLGMCGGIIEGGKITNGKLPRGEWYWSVYVEAPRKSSVFAPIYKQGTTGEDAHYRLHATVNNYPETDGFGHIYAVQYDTRAGSAKKSLMVYNFNANDNSNDNQANISNSTRYKLLNEYVNHTGSKPKFENQRRLAVAPDGKVYISDHGLTDRTQYSTQAWADRPMLFTNGGIWVWDPKSQTEDYVQISMFLNDKTESSSGLAIYDHGNQVKLYGMNTYGEFADHTGGYKWKGLEYTEANQASTSVYGWNGFKEYNLGTKENILYQETAGTTLQPLGMGDGNGNISIVAMDKGVWMAQHRMNDVQYTIDVFKDNNSQKPALPDNTENYILSFVPYGSNTRTWRSCTTRGIDYNGSTFTQTTASELTQLTTSPLQSCPGAGLAYRKTTTGKESLYIVNHQGDIVELQITSWSGTTPSVKYIKTWPGSGAKGQNDGKRTQGFITTMNFDYAGNLITTSGAGYTDNSQDIIVYTMPYNRVNAREIQAPNSCRYIPERVSHLNMGDEELSNIISENKDNTCHVDIFRPMFNTSFSTICLPFDVDLSQASANEYKDAKLMKFAEAVITDINKEKMLELRFTEITDGKLEAGIPYLIQPQEPITQIVHLAQLVSFKSITPEDQKLDFTDGDQNNSITFKGIIPYQQIEVDPNKPWPLIVVDNNRLAEVSTTGYINGFRAYFQLENELAPGTKVGISARKPTPTNVITIDGKRVNIEKFLREGRVYIRVGDSLYTITGEKVE